MRFLIFVTAAFAFTACQTSNKNTSSMPAVGKTPAAATADQSRKISSTTGQLTDHLVIDACRVDVAPCPAADVIPASDETNLGLTIHSNRVDFGYAEGTACQIDLDASNIYQHSDGSILVSALNKTMNCIHSCEAGDTSEGCPQPTTAQINFIYVGLRHVGRATLIEAGPTPLNYYRNKRFLTPR